MPRHPDMTLDTGRGVALDAPSRQNPDMTWFLNRIGPELAASFSPAQLAALELHFAMRHRSGHAIDWRRRFGRGRMSAYVVVLAGKARAVD